MLYGPFTHELEYFHRKWDPSRVDWNDVAFEGVGAFSSIVGLNSVAEAFQYGKTIKDIAEVTDVTTSVIGYYKASKEGDLEGMILSLGGLVPGPIGTASSFTSLYLEISKGYYWTH